MQLFPTRILVVSGLLFGALVAVSAAPAGAGPPSGRAESSSARIMWDSYDGVRIGMSVPRAARRLDRRVRTDPCTPGRWITDYAAGGRVRLAETIRRDGKINELFSSSARVRGPSGVRPGMRVSKAAQRLRRDGHRVSYSREWNDAYHLWMHWAYARGPRGRVLLLSRDGGQVRWIASFVDMRLARWQMRAPGGC